MARLSLYSIVFLVIAGVLLIALPPLREIPTDVVCSIARGDPVSFGELWFAAAEHPHDLFMQLALAPDGLYPDYGSPDTELFQRTFSIAPDSPAPHLRLGMALLEGIDGVGMGRDGKLYYPTLSATEKEFLTKAIEQLRLTASLAKDNAAPDFLLAFALLGDKQDLAAEAALRTALGKPGWTVYEPELRRAKLALYKESGASDTVAAIALLADWPSYLNSKLRSFTRFLITSAENFRRAGDEGQALLYYCSMVHLGDVALCGADSFIDALVADAILAIAADDFITPAERRQIATSSLSDAEKRKRGNEVRQRGLLSYLRANGQDRLADRYQKDLAYMEPFMVSIRKINAREAEEDDVLLDPPLQYQGILGWIEFLMGATLLAAVLSFYLLLCTWRQRSLLPGWRFREWLLLVVITILPAYLLLSVQELLGELPDRNINRFLWWDAGLSLLLLLLCTIVAAMLKRRRIPPESRPTRSRSAVDALRIMLPPTVALLLIAGFTLSLPTARAFSRFSEKFLQQARQGEINYWQLGRPAP